MPDDFSVAAVARSDGPPQFCFPTVCRVEASGTPIFCPEMPLASFPDCAVPRSPPCCNVATAVAKRYVQLNQLSLACPVKRAQPPWTVDDKALMP